MFTENEQNNQIYRGYNPAFVKCVIAKRKVGGVAPLKPGASMADIVSAVAEARKLSVSDLRGLSKNRDVQRARGEAIGLIRQLRPDLTSFQLGMYFNRDPALIRKNHAWKGAS